MAKLIRAILIDSLCAGERAEIKLDANTSITGTNGVGKSSFLKLVPIFYGASPGRVVKADGNNKSFAHWYLPHESSFIIFEYDSGNNKRCCAIVHRKGDTYAYRLVSGPWVDELVYRDVAAGILMPTNELMPHISRMNRICTEEINPGAYRAVIQFNTGNANLERITDPGLRKKIEVWRRDFSLAPKNREFAGIDKVTLAMINEGSSFESIAEVMASILRQDYGDLDAILKPLAAHGFRSLLSDIDSYHIYESKVRDKLLELDKVYVEYVNSSRLLSRAKQRALLSKELLEAERIELEEKRREMENLASRNRDLIEQEREQLGKEHGIALSLQSKLSTDIDRITRKQAEYAEMDIETLIALCADRERLTIQLDQKQQELNQLHKESGDIQYRYSQKEVRVVTDAEELKAKRRAESETAERELQARVLSIQEMGRDQLGELEAQQLSVSDEIEARRLSSSTAYLEKQAELNQIRLTRLLPEDQLALDKAYQDVQLKQEATQACLARLDGLKLDEQALKQQQTTNADSQSRYERSLQSLTEKRVDLANELNASEDTLLGFLRRHHPSWTQTIGKLVPASTLMRKDLNPEMSHDGEGTLFGVNLNLDPLPSQMITDSTEIQNAIGRVAADIEAITAEADELKKSARKLDAQFRSLAEEVRTAKSDLARAESDLDEAKLHRQGVEERGLGKRIDQFELLEATCHALQAQAKQISEEQTEVRREHGRQRSHLVQATKLAVDGLTDEIAQLRTSLAAELATIEQGKVKALNELKAHLDLALKDAGIDSSLSRKLEREIQSLEEKLKDIKTHQTKVDQYHQWKADTLPLLDSLYPQLEAAEANLANIVRRQERVTQRYTDLNQQTNTDRRLLDKAQGDVGRDLATTSRVLEMLHDLAPDESATLEANKRIQDIDLEADSAKKAREALTKQGRSLYADVIQIYSGELLTSQHGKAINQLASDARNDMGFDMAWTGAAGQLLSYMETFHAEQRSKLIIAAQNLSSSVCNSKHRLDDLHKSILKLGREATEKAQSASTSFKSIEHVEFHMDSKVRGLDFWTYLEEYEKAYQRWQSTAPDEFPPQAFKLALQRIEQFTRTQKLQSKAEPTILDCFTVRIDVIDKGNMKKATNNSEFNGLSSEGLRKILLCMLFVSLFELVRDDADLQLVIPLDEILKLAAENYISVVHSINDRGAVALAGFPGAAELSSQFENNYVLKLVPTGIDIREFVHPEDEDDALSGLVIPSATGEAFA